MVCIRQCENKVFPRCILLVCIIPLRLPVFRRAPTRFPRVNSSFSQIDLNGHCWPPKASKVP